jgi:hypothetical protein
VSRVFMAAVLALGLPVAMIAGAPAATAERSEQVVFSGTGGGDFGPFGFWVWCQVQTTNPYETDCNGALYFYQLHLTKQVTGDVSEPADDQYQMDLASSNGSVECTLINEPPIVSGPHNTVDASCSSPAGKGTSTNAVVTNNG